MINGFYFLRQQCSNDAIVPWYVNERSSNSRATVDKTTQKTIFKVDFFLLNAKWDDLCLARRHQRLCCAPWSEQWKSQAMSTLWGEPGFFRLVQLQHLFGKVSSQHKLIYNKTWKFRVFKWYFWIMTNVLFLSKVAATYVYICMSASAYSRTIVEFFIGEIKSFNNKLF